MLRYSCATTLIPASRSIWMIGSGSKHRLPIVVLLGFSDSLSHWLGSSGSAGIALL
jgi:hypothetical protein